MIAPVVYVGTLAVETDSLLIASKVAVSVGEADAVRGVVVLDGQRYRWSTIQQFEQYGGFGAESLASMSAIETEADYNTALAEVEALMMVEDGTPEADRLDRLVTLVEAYEDEHYPMDD